MARRKTTKSDLCRLPSYQSKDKKQSWEMQGILVSQKNEKHKKVVMKPDLTQFQKEAEKKLVEEKKRRNREAEEKKETTDWVIYRGRMVRKSSIKTPKASVGTSMTSLLEEFKDAPQSN